MVEEGEEKRSPEEQNRHEDRTEWYSVVILLHGAC